ncbi:hypothetical protein [Nocardia otitidiscaviarum]|uniref:hypothetical protein n=1 Tax=Nocardia otitidiscaviarum TaxID=1823 RepID=UPI000694D625|nr:hypothetical protein [Nocardia otitidiscaviarum]
MQNITIGRYQTDDFTHLHTEDGTPAEEIAAHFAGWIEGVRDDGSTWIMYLDAHGNPETFWGRREDTGAVIGDPIILAP